MFRLGVKIHTFVDMMRCVYVHVCESKVDVLNILLYVEEVEIFSKRSEIHMSNICFIYVILNNEINNVSRSLY